MDAQIVREFNDRGLVRLLESPVNFGNFVRLFPKSLADRLDVSRLELKNRVFIAPDLSKSETDILYSVPCRMNENESLANDPAESVLIYLLSELYTRPDKKIGKKIYERRGQIWENEDRKWQEMTSPRPDFHLHLVISVVFYVGEEPWNSSLELDDLVLVPEGLEGYLPRWQTIMIPLREVPPEILLHEGTGVALALLTLRTALFEPDSLPARIQEISEGISKLLSETEWRDAAQYVIAAILNKCKADIQPELFEIVEQTASRTNMNRKEVNTMIVTGADVLREEGMKLGIEKGKREGKRIGRKEGKIQGKREGKIEALSEVNQTLYELLLVDIESKFGSEAANKAIAGKTYDASETLEIIQRLTHATKIEDLGL